MTRSTSIGLGSFRSALDELPNAGSAVAPMLVAMELDSQFILFTELGNSSPEQSAAPSGGLLSSPTFWLGGLVSAGFWAGVIRLCLS